MPTQEWSLWVLRYNNMKKSQKKMSKRIELCCISQFNIFYKRENDMLLSKKLHLQNKTFMITGRYASSQSLMVDEDEDFEEEHPKFGEQDEENIDEEYCEDYGNRHMGEDAADNSFNWQWDDNVNQDCAQSKTQENADKVNSEDDQVAGNGPHDKPKLEMPEGVEKLTPEDIRIFLENESVVAAQSGS
jgi:hypothetical protein